jgi:hypothetical protein
MNAERKLVIMYCKRWDCPTCNPIRRRVLIARIFSGSPERWMTLTIDAKRPGGPLEHFAELRKAFNDLQKRIRRKYPAKRFEYVAVVEATKQGEPHLHIAFRGPWIDQSWLSAQMDDLIGSPICDIRWLHGKKQTLGYICKYIGKKPHQFGSHKRYWFSRDYEPDWKDDRDKEPGYINAWRVVRSHPMEVIKLWSQEGYVAFKFGKGCSWWKRC